MGERNKLQCAFLLVTAAGLTPIALSYGLAPRASLPWLFGIDADGVNTRHIFRAMMGLYLAWVGFCISAAFRADLRIPALWSLLVFMSGLALGRVLSIAVDGWPQPLLSLYMVLEIAIAVIAWRMLNAVRNDPGLKG